MSIIKHFSEGNNDQQYENLHSHWKEDYKEMTNQSMSEPIITTYNTAYNQAIQDAIDVIWKHRFVYTGAADLVEQLNELEKPS